MDTWNVTGITGEETELLRWIKDSKIRILTLTETKMKISGTRKSIFTEIDYANSKWKRDA